MIREQLQKRMSRYAPRWLVLGIDTLLIVQAFILAYLIRFNLTLSFDTDKLLMQIPLVMVAAIVAFLATGSHKGLVRHAGVKDIYNLFNAICLMSILIIISVPVNRWIGIVDNFTIPLSIIIIHSLLSFLSLSALRVILRALFDRMARNISEEKNVIIYGAGQSGIATNNVLTNHPKSVTKVVAFLDDDKSKIGKRVNGIQVFPGSALNADFLKRRNVKEIIVAIHNIDQNKLREIIEGMVELEVQVKIIPPIQDWINGELSVSQIKNVQIEDLLNRAPINIVNEHVSRELQGKRIVVTGGAGSIGSEIVRQISHYEYAELIIIDQAESPLYDLQQELRRAGCKNFTAIVSDIRDYHRMKYLFEKHRPEILFHAAAYKHVPLMEYNYYEAVKINIGGTRNLANLAIETGVGKFVFVSTDKAVNPTNVMGATKRIAEILVSCKQKAAKTKFITTRFGNVLGSNGSVIPLFRKQIEEGGPLTVTHKDITRYFMTIPEASQLVLEAGCMGKGGEIFIFDMGEAVKIFDLAKNMIKLSGLRYPEDIDIQITGLRPGEKLYEELLANGEDTLPTYNKKIMISKVRDLCSDDIRAKIDQLCELNLNFDESVIPLMKEIVPEFISNNSELSKFDSDREPDKKKN